MVNQLSHCRIFSRQKAVLYIEMLWDDLPLKPNKRLRVGPQTPSFPVAIGAGSHPFPFRTRKLSLLPPMVLPAQVGGRVGRCRGLIQSLSEKSLRLFSCTPALPGLSFYRLTVCERSPSPLWSPSLAAPTVRRLHRRPPSTGRKESSRSRWQRRPLKYSCRPKSRTR